MTNICFISPHAYALLANKPKLSFGGSEIRLVTLARSLREENYKIKFIVADFGQSPVEEINGITVIRSFSMHNSLRAFLAFPIKLWQALHQAKSDVYILAAAGPEAGIVAVYCRFMGKKFIFTTASSIDCTKEITEKIGPIKSFLYRLGLSQADCVVVQAKEHQRALQKYWQKKSVVIRNGLIIKSRKASSKDYILWVGSAQRLKQPEKYFDLAKRFPNESFVMILSPSADAKYYTQLFDQARKIPNLKIIKRVPFHKIQAYYDRAKVLVGTSVYEGFPNTYLQACISGVPIVSLTVNPDQFITKHKLGYVANWSSQKMMEYLERLISDSKTYQLYATNAYNYVSRYHNIKKNTQEWTALIASLTG